MMEASDAAVVTQVRAGDHDAFRVLLERHGPAIFRLAYRMTGNEQDAEDVLQETFLRAFRHLHRFETEASFPAWLHRIAVNYSINFLRQRRREPRAWAPAAPFEPDGRDALPAGGPTPDGAAFNAEVRRQVLSMLDQLSPRERAAFVLRHFESRSIDEISAALGLGTSAAKQCVFRAVQKLRRGLKPIWEAAQ